MERRHGRRRQGATSSRAACSRTSRCTGRRCRRRARSTSSRKDKHSWVIAPAFYNQPTNKGGGVGFGENNLFGQNQKLLLYGQIATGDSFFIGAWVIPAIGGTRFYAQFDTFLEERAQHRVRRADRATSIVTTATILTAGPRVAHPLPQRRRASSASSCSAASRSTPACAARRSATRTSSSPSGATARRRRGRSARPIRASLPAPGDEGWDISNECDAVDRSPRELVRHPDRAQVRGRRSSTRCRRSARTSTTGSSALEHLQGVARSSSATTSSSKASPSYGHNLPFQQEFLTGGTSMRGWLNNQFRGDFKRDRQRRVLGADVHDLRASRSRGLAFFDSAYTTFTAPTTTRNPQRNYLPELATCAALDAVQELGRRRNALLSAADRAATPGPRFWVWSRSP